MSPVTPPPLRQRLREETRPQHEAVEAAVGLFRTGLNEADYARYLARMFGFLAPLESRLLEGGVRGVDDLGARCDKAALLRSDLAALGWPPSSLDRLATAGAQAVPPIDSEARRMGCLYVLEGSTLGGQVVLRRLRAALPETASRASRFLEGYGPLTRDRWNAFERALAGFEAANPTSAGDVVQGAVATFEAMTAWFAAAFLASAAAARGSVG